MAALAALGLALAGCSDGGTEAGDGIEGQNENIEGEGAITGDGEGPEEDDSAVPEDYDTDPGIIEERGDEDGIGED